MDASKIVFVLAISSLICQCTCIPAVGHGALSGFCNSNTDCPRLLECCVHFDDLHPSEPTGLASGLEGIVTGKCFNVILRPYLQCMVN